MIPRPIPSIKHVSTSGNKHLITDRNNRLWVLGKNKHWRLGVSESGLRDQRERVSPETDLLQPRRIPIQLEPTETINKFYVCERLVAIHTSHKRLFVSRIVSPSVLGERIADLDETSAVYLYPAAPTAPITSYYEPEESWSNQFESIHHSHAELGSMPDLTDLLEDTSDSSDVRFRVPESNEPIPECVSMPEVLPSEDVSEPIDTTSFGFDREAAALEAIDHDFGLGKHFYDEAKMLECISSRLGDSLAKQAGFIEPLVDIDEVMCANEVVFFRKGSSIHIYSWRLTPKIAMANNAGLALVPIQHAKSITYYQIILPFTPDVVEYQGNHIYMKAGPLHHVLTAYKTSISPSSIISWLYFPFENLKVEAIHISTVRGLLYVHEGSSVYQYMHLFKGLRPIMLNRTHILVTRVCNGGIMTPFCLRDDGALISHTGELTYSPPDPWLKHTVGVSVISEAHHAILVEVPIPEGLPMAGDASHRFKLRGDTLLINVCVLTPCYKLTLKLTTDGGSQYHIHRWIDIPPVTSIVVGNESILFEAKGAYYRSAICSTFGPATEITLEPTKRKPAEIKDRYIAHGSLKRGKEVIVQIETYGNLFDRLCAFAEMFGTDVKLALRYTHRAVGVSYGGGIRRVFVHDALSQFADSYLIRHGAGSEYNLTALSVLPTPKLFIMGRALHMAMHMNRTCLSIRLPIVFSVELLNREPEIGELEFFLQKESPELYDTITSYFDDPEGLVECGYDSYRECLQHRIYYEHLDPEANSQARRITRALVQGFTSYAPVSNIRSMNMPTIDSYLSGPYCIDRKLLTSVIRGNGNSNCNALVKFIKGLIERLPEDRLGVLLPTDRYLGS